MALAALSPMRWSAKDCEPYSPMCAKMVAAAAAASPRPELAVAWVGDLASRGACDELLAAAHSAVGRVTHFVHSAAPQRHEADHALAVTTETWERMHAVNVDSGFHLARELARQLIAADQPGSFLMLTSLHAGTPRNFRTTAQPKRRSPCW
jgi:3-oxoacyl-[acyl-carrier protein] reductase